MKRIVWYTALVLTTLSFLVLLWQFRLAIILFALSLATAAAFRPAVESLVKRGLRRGIALFLVYFLTLGVIGGAIFLISGPLIQDLQHAIDDLVTGYDDIIDRWPTEGSAFQRWISAQLPPLEVLYTSLTGEQGRSAIQSFMGAASSVFDLVGNLAIILILSMYWSVDTVRFERLWLSLVPVERRAHLRSIWRSTEEGVGSYIRNRVIQSLVTGMLLWLGYYSIGIEYAALLALLGALTRLIPWLGTILAIFPPLLVGLGDSPGLAILAALFTLLVLVAMELVLSPRFFTSQNYSSLLIVLVTIALAYGFGLLGLVLAPPLAVAIQIIFEKTIQPPPAAPSSEILLPQPQGSTLPLELERLRDRLEATRNQIETGDGPPAPEIQNLINRLDGLIDRTYNYLTFGQKARPE